MPWRTDDPLEHDALRIRYLPVERLQVACLGMAAEPENVTDRPQVFRAAIRAGQHHDRADPGQFPAAALLQHPGEAPLQDQAPLAMGDDRDVRRLRERDRILGGRALGDVVVVRDARRRQGQPGFLGEG